MPPTDPPAVSFDEGSSSSDEIGNLERRRGHTLGNANLIIPLLWERLLGPEKYQQRETLGSPHS